VTGDDDDVTYTRRHAKGAGGRAMVALARAAAERGDYEPVKEMLRAAGIEEGSDRWNAGIEAARAMFRRAASPWPRG
jgi:hypothetical protein